MAKAKRLIIGLGNPGDQYDGTRHNVGFAVVDALAESLDLEFEKPGGGKFFASLFSSYAGSDGSYTIAWGRYKSRVFGVVKPLTYMNRSGTAIKPLMRKHGLSAQDILVVTDDIHLELGALRMKAGGSAGGHNGLENISTVLSSANFPRLRVGVGGNFARGQQSDFVLSRFDSEEQVLMDETIQTAKASSLSFVTDGLKSAMNRYNRKKTPDVSSTNNKNK